MSELQHYTYLHPAMAVDLILFGIVEQTLKVLVGRRAAPPYKGKACLPGTYVRKVESAEEACARKIKAVGLAHSYLEQLYTFTDPKRDPRERVISVAYFGLIAVPNEVPAGDDKIDKLEWMEPTAAANKTWSFDHAAILTLAVERVRSKIQYAPLSPHFLSEAFTLKELSLVYGAILGRKVDLSNFRRDLLKQELVVPVGTRRLRGPTAITFRWNWENKTPFFLSLG